MRKNFLGALLVIIGLATYTYAQEAQRLERGLNIIRGNLTLSVGDLVLSSTSDIQPASGQNLILQTNVLSKSVRLNSITDSTTTSGDLIGFQSKPRTGVAGTQNVYGGQISAQISNGIALSSGGSMIGLHVDNYVRGTAAGTIAGDVRGMQIELVTDDAGTRTVSGTMEHLRLRTAFSGTGITGIFSAIKIEKPEVQTNSLNFDGVLNLTSTLTGVWHDTDSDSGDTEAGYIKVYVNGNARYILLYSDAPTL